MRTERHAARQRRFYDSRRHEHLQTREGDLYARKLVDRLANEVGIGPEDRVLELGAGFGRFTFPLLTRCASVVAVDLSEAALGTLARIRDERAIPASRIETHCIDLESLEPGKLDERFDFVVGFFLLHHLADMQRSIASVSRLLSSGGRMGFLEPNRRNPLFVAQVAACPDMSWAEERGMFLLSESGVLEAYRNAGLEHARSRRIGFFPPQIFNRAAFARRLEGRLEESRLLQPMLPFLLLTARAPLVPGRERRSVNEADFRLLDAIEEDHWWFVGKRFILRALLDQRPAGGRMLDLGCGTGGVLRDWGDRNRCFGVDRSRLALKMCARRGFDSLACGDLDRIPLKARSFDTVLILDVIEHLDDDVGFLRVAADLCGPDSRLVISVPAFQMLWSQHDEAFQHRRRYSARELRAAVERAGLVVERMTYTNMFVFPVASVWRILSYRLGLGRFAPQNDFWPVPRWLNQLLTLQYRFEAWLLRHLDLPFGVSVLCTARRAD